MSSMIDYQLLVRRLGPLGLVLRGGLGQCKFCKILARAMIPMVELCFKGRIRSMSLPACLCMFRAWLDREHFPRLDLWTLGA